MIRHGRHIPGKPGHRTTRYTPGAPGSYVEYIQQGMHQPGQPIPGMPLPGQPMPAQSMPAGQPTPAGQPMQPGSYGSCPSTTPASGPASTYPGPTSTYPGPTSTYPGPTSTYPDPTPTYSAPEPTNPDPTSPPRTCHHCGTSARGCTTVSRFAFNSAELKTSHKAQLRQLAERILRQNSNAVIATGHADSSGTEDYNEALGERRAAAVVKELKKQMSLLKPGSQKLLFWKIDSKGETMPVSRNNAAANRRVTICVRKGSFTQ